MSGNFDVTKTYTYLSNQGTVKVCGCLGCGKTFLGSYKGKGKKGKNAVKPVIAHMETCCPEILARNERNLFQKCWIRCSNCIVPGFEGGNGSAEDEILKKHMQQLSEKQQPQHDPNEEPSMWLKYQHKLHENVTSENAIVPVPEGVFIRKLYDVLNDKLRTDTMLNAYGVSGAFGNNSVWITWALNIAVSHSDNAKKVWEQHQSYMHKHIKLLDKLAKEQQEGYCGSEAYIDMLNFIMHEAFTMCGLPLPPGMNLSEAMSLRGDGPQFKARMRSFRGYRLRVFGVIDLIVENLTQIIKEEKS